MPSSRKQKARKKPSTQSDALAEMKNLDITLGNFPENDLERHEVVGGLDADLGSERQERDTS